MKPKNITVMISGGGTGGHIFPAIAIADEIRRRLPETTIVFVGAKGRMEMEKVPTAGYPIHGIWISGFQRKALLKNLSFPFKLLSSLLKSKLLIRKYQPDLVVGTGGFASGPLLQVAAASSIPCLIQEQNSFPGITNRLLGKKANVICVAYDNMNRWFPEEKLRFTGNPVRKSIVNSKYNSSKEKEILGFDANRPLLLVTGGSLGARKINEAVATILPKLKEKDVQVLWQCGSLYAKELQANTTLQNRDCRIQAFVTDMAAAYAAADIVISRAGASTLSELAIAAKAAILIPSPNVAEDHQTKNAKALADKQAAVVLPEIHLQERLFEEVLALLEIEKRQLQEKTIKALAKPHATEHIVDELFKLIAL